MGVNRGRIIVNYNNLDFKELLRNKNNIDIVYDSQKEQYLIIYCDKQDASYLLETLKNDPSVIEAYLSNERVESYNF